MAYQFAISNPVFMLVFSATALVLSTWIYPRKPKNEVVTRRWQCSLSDVLVLLWQFGLTGVLVFSPDEEFGVGMELAGLAVLWVLLALGWVMTVRWLSRSSVDDRLLRLLMIGIISPVVFCWPTVALLGLCFMFSGLPPVVLAVLLYGCAKMARWITARSAQQQKTERRASRYMVAVASVALALIMPAVITLPACTDYTVGPVYCKAHLRRFRQRIIQEADLGELQRWADSAGFDSIRKAFKDKTIPLIQCPPAVQALKPTYVDPTPEGWLCLTWGGGFGHWGVTVAPRGTPTPPSNTSGQSGDYILPVQDGIWVWIQIQ